MAQPKFGVGDRVRVRESGELVDVDSVDTSGEVPRYEVSTSLSARSSLPVTFDIVNEPRWIAEDELEHEA